jgi:hypothetical protein
VTSSRGDPGGCRGETIAMAPGVCHRGQPIGIVAESDPSASRAAQTQHPARSVAVCAARPLIGDIGAAAGQRTLEHRTLRSRFVAVASSARATDLSPLKRSGGSICLTGRRRDGAAKLTTRTGNSVSKIPSCRSSSNSRESGGRSRPALLVRDTSRRGRCDATSLWTLRQRSHLSEPYGTIHPLGAYSGPVERNLPRLKCQRFIDGCSRSMMVGHEILR